jgi:hypothetical protein
MKRCTKCFTEKELERFKLRTDTGLYRNICKDCQNNRCKELGFYKNWVIKMLASQNLQDSKEAAV